MPAFVFLGGPECGDVGGVTMFGIWFPVGAVVEVTDRAIAGKLRGNMFFREVEAGDPPAPETGADNTYSPVVKRRGRPPRV